MTITPDKLRACARAQPTSNGPQWAPIEARDCMMLADAVEIADASSAALIECSAHLYDDRGHSWRDLASVEPIDSPGIEQAVQYLTARGLIERHPEQGQWVRVRDVQEVAG